MILQMKFLKSVPTMELDNYLFQEQNQWKRTLYPPKTVAKQTVEKSFR